MNEHRYMVMLLIHLIVDNGSFYNLPNDFVSLPRRASPREDSRYETRKTMRASRPRPSNLWRQGCYNPLPRPLASNWTDQGRAIRLSQRNCCKISLGHKPLIYSTHRRPCLSTKVATTYPRTEINLNRREPCSIGGMSTEGFGFQRFSTWLPLLAI